jgi:hypothetical protein
MMSWVKKYVKPPHEIASLLHNDSHGWLTFFHLLYFYFFHTFSDFNQWSKLAMPLSPFFFISISEEDISSVRSRQALEAVTLLGMDHPSLEKPAGQ